MQIYTNCKLDSVFFQPFARMSATKSSNFVAIIGQIASNMQNLKTRHEKIAVHVF